MAKNYKNYGGIASLIPKGKENAIMLQDLARLIGLSNRETKRKIQELRRQTDGVRKPFYLACVTKEPVPDIAVIQISDEIMAECLKEIEYAAGRYQAIKMGLLEPTRCEKCDWCKATKVLEGVELYG